MVWATAGINPYSRACREHIYTKIYTVYYQWCSRDCHPNYTSPVIGIQLIDIFMPYGVTSLGDLVGQDRRRASSSWVPL